MRFEGSPQFHSVDTRKGDSTKRESEPSAKEGLDRLHSALDSRTIKNADGIDVTLHVRREKIKRDERRAEQLF